MKGHSPARLTDGRAQGVHMPNEQIAVAFRQVDRTAFRITLPAAPSW